MKKAVIDTNIVVSGFLSPMGKPATILKLTLGNHFEICFNTAILNEYEQVLCRSKFAGKIYQPDIQRFFEIIYNIGTEITGIPSNIEMPDESDRIFYDTAKAGNAILITGNLKHYPPNEPFIMTPTQFLISLDEN
ncbi:MAG: putative toxin-antitoxin system toxin component, PIN family [Oscillospiraceae bacterium]|nr:putative toxin-antitoxin system toxin component, PIN family [Oscillospiraceae bacterium]